MNNIYPPPRNENPSNVSQSYVANNTYPPNNVVDAQHNHVPPHSPVYNKPSGIVVFLIVLLVLIFFSIIAVGAFLLYDKFVVQPDEVDTIIVSGPNRIIEEIITPDKLPDIPDGGNTSKDEYPGNAFNKTYSVIKSDMSWTQAYTSSEGALVSIDSKKEFDEVCRLAENNDLIVFWVSPDSTYQYWYKNEPSFVNEDGEPEHYLMVFKVNGSWYFNDSVNDVSAYYAGKMGYITEYYEGAMYE